MRTSTAVAPYAERAAATPVVRRDATIDTMRGIAILMVIGIHSLNGTASWTTALDAALRPCVPIFLFTSGYMTARTLHVPLGRRIATAIIPYAIAFAAAYAYMTLHNPEMDHRPWLTLARFGTGFVFVYYYVVIYVGCTLMLWAAIRIADLVPARRDERLRLLLGLAILLGLVAGAYLDPVLARFGIGDAVIDEARARDIPFWFGFMALGLLAGMTTQTALSENWRMLGGAALVAYALYVLVRLASIGDAAAYDSIAFFGYAALACLSLTALMPRAAPLSFIGSGAYFIYLWHIFVIYLLRDHAILAGLSDFTATLVTFLLATGASVAGLWLLRRSAPPHLTRWLGA